MIVGNFERAETGLAEIAGAELVLGPALLALQVLD
jgi:hypothetical protein